MVNPANQRLKALEGIGTKLDNLVDKLLNQLRHLVKVGDSHLIHLDPLRLQPQTVEGFTDISHPFVGNLAALDKMALIIVAVICNPGA